MDKSGEIQQEQQHVTGVAPGASQTDPLVASGIPSVAVHTPAQPPPEFSNSVDHLAYLQAQYIQQQQQQQQDIHLAQQQLDFSHQQQQRQHLRHKLQKQQNFHHQLPQQLKVLWAKQMEEIGQTNCFTKPSLPVNRIRRIMQMDEDVRMVSSEALVLFVKACEMFTLDLTVRSWTHAEVYKRRRLQKNDVAAAIASNFAFEFLVDSPPKDELKEEEGPGIAQSTIPIEEGLGTAQSTIPIEEGLGTAQSTFPIRGLAADLPHYYVPPQLPVDSTGMIMGNPVDQATLNSAQQPRPPMAFMSCPNANPQPRNPVDQAALYSAQQPRPPMTFTPWPNANPQSGNPVDQAALYSAQQPRHPMTFTPWPNANPQPGNPVDQAALYSSQQPRPPMTFMPWPNANPQPGNPVDQAALYSAQQLRPPMTFKPWPNANPQPPRQ